MILYRLLHPMIHVLDPMTTCFQQQSSTQSKNRRCSSYPCQVKILLKKVLKNRKMTTLLTTAMFGTCIITTNSICFASNTIIRDINAITGYDTCVKHGCGKKCSHITDDGIPCTSNARSGYDTCVKHGGATVVRNVLHYLM